MTDSAADRVARFVDDQLHGRRPRRFAASKEEAEAMTAAAGLVAGREGADIPDQAALDRLHRKINAALNQSPGLDLRATRRTWLRPLGTAAAAVVVGVALDEVATNQPQAGTGGGAAPVLMPDNGTWRRVAAVTELPAGHAMPVTTGSVDAVVVNDGGNISAVSGICTHLGCKLQPDDANRKLNCPCHMTAFSWSGKVLYYKLKSEPATLPQIPVR